MKVAKAVAIANTSRALARNPLSPDEILTGFYRPGRLLVSAEARADSLPVPAGQEMTPALVPSRPARPARNAPAEIRTEAPIIDDNLHQRLPGGVPGGMPDTMPESMPETMPETIEEIVEDSGEARVPQEAPIQARAQPRTKPRDKGSKPKPTHYKIVCISLYVEDIAHLDGLVAELKRRGHTKANKSQVIRAALEQMDLDKVPKAP